MSSFLIIYFLLLSLINIIYAQTSDIDKSICNTTECINLNPANLYIQCKSKICELDCTAPNSCNNILYSCGTLNDYGILNSNETTICRVNCLSSNSCTNLTVISESGETEIHCNTADSCIDTDFVCNPSLQINNHMVNDTECNLDCSMKACNNINYLCTGYTSICNAECDGDQSCNSLNMICDQHISNINSNTMTCDLLCNTNVATSNSCDASSKFSCTDSSDAICECIGDCNELKRINVDTGSPTNHPITSRPSPIIITSVNNTESPSPSPSKQPSISSEDAEQSNSHTFDIIDVEVYAVFTILWLLLFVFSLLLCWRLQVTLDFFRNIRTVVMLVILFVFEVFYYWIFSFVLWANAIAYSVESSIHFYVWTSYLPIILHISLLFSLCAYYNKHFHRDTFLALFCCYNKSKKKIPKLLKQFNCFLFVIFMIPMIGIVAAHDQDALIAIVVFIGLFGLLGLIISIIQFLTSIIDLKDINNYEQQVEKVLIIFVLITSMLFMIIFCINLTIAFEWNAAKTTQNIEGIRVTQLTLELIMLIAMISMIFYIYYDYIMGIEEEEDDDDDDEEYEEEEEINNEEEEEEEESEDLEEESVNNDDNTPTDGYPVPHIPHQPVTSDSYQKNHNTQSTKQSINSGRGRARSKVFNDPSDDEEEEEEHPRITRRSIGNGRKSKSKSTQKQMRMSINSGGKEKPYHRTSSGVDDDGYNTGDAVDIFYSNEWCKAMVSETMKNKNKIRVRILDGPSIHDEIIINIVRDADKIRFNNEDSMDDDENKGDDDEYRHHHQQRSSIQEIVRDKFQNDPPPSIEDAITTQNKIRKAKGRKLPDLPKFGAPLNKQKLIIVQDDDFEYFSEIPNTLVLLKRYLFKFNGDQYIGIFANGSIENISKSPKFMNDGIVSMVDCNGVKKLIENNKISQHKFKNKGGDEEKHYAMIFAELIKLWLSSLPEPLLQDMPSTFFGDITSTEFLEMEIEKINEPNLSTLMLIWDICVIISIKSKINKMTIKRLSRVFAPYLFKDKNKERNAQLKPTIINFCQIGINWRLEQSNYH